MLRSFIIVPFKWEHDELVSGDSQLERVINKFGWTRQIGPKT